MTRPRVGSRERLWAILPDRLQSLIDLADKAPPQPGALSLGAAGARQGYENCGGVAIVDVAGSLTKCGDFWDMIFGTGSAMLDIAAAINAAIAAESVDSILLRIDSPGGTVAGTADLAEAVSRANAIKPVVGYCEDLCASAAYWVASQCSAIYSNATAMIGSIGTFATVEDSSELATKLGIKVRVVKAGEMKGAGVDGTPVTDEQLADVQRIIDSLNEHFIAGVAAGRKMSVKATRDLADGRVHVGADAAQLGLTDGVKSFADVLAGMQAATRRTAANKIPAMTNDTPALQTAHDLERNIRFQGRWEADRLRAHQESYAQQFIQEVRDIMRGGRTQAEAQRIAAKRCPEYAACYAAVFPRQEAAAPAAAPDDPVADFKAAVGKLTARGMTRTEAVKEVSRRNPQLYAAYRESTS